MSTSAPWDHETDVLVVGAGAAGLAAAIAAATHGAAVSVIERTPQAGGTTAKSGGTFWIPNNQLMREAGLEDPRPDALRYMARLAYPTLYDPAHPTLGLEPDDFAQLATFFDRGSEVIEALRKADAIHPVVDLATPSYHAELPEERCPYGRSLQPSGKPKDQTYQTGGEVMIAQMLSAAEGLGVQVFYDHRAAALVQDEAGRVLGLEARTGHRTVLLGARRAVVFGSGGFLHDRTLARNFLRGPVFGGCAAPTSTGDFVRISMEAGAELANMSHAWWSQVVLDMALRTPATIRDVWIPFGDSMIQVDRLGRRVVNEKMPYNERTQVHFSWDATTKSYANLILFMIYDEVVATDTTREFRDPVPLPGQEVDFVLSGDTWEDLAAEVDRHLADIAPRTGGFRLDASFAANLAETVRRFNDHADQGHDPDFRRGESPIQLAWGGGHRNALNPTMHRFSDTGPYHCILLGPGSLDTKGGPRINTDAQVMHLSGEPILGLYGAGNCIGSPAGQAYWGPGATIGLALTFGYIAGAHAAREQDCISHA